MGLSWDARASKFNAVTIVWGSGDFTAEMLAPPAHLNSAANSPSFLYLHKTPNLTWNDGVSIAEQVTPLLTSSTSPSTLPTLPCPPEPLAALWHCLSIRLSLGSPCVIATQGQGWDL